jgi:phosphoenolpyruvate-protein phosphotransferase
MMKGCSLSPGIAQGVAFVVAPWSAAGAIENGDVQVELDRLRVAVAHAELELSSLIANAASWLGSAAAEMFRAQILVLRDSSFLGPVTKLIRENRKTVEAALDETQHQISEAFAAVSDPYIRERASDIRDVVRRVLVALSVQQPLAAPFGSIVVMRELLPTVVAGITPDTVRAFVTERGGMTSHAAILARMIGIPVVAGVDAACTAIRSGDPLIVDAIAGLVFPRPSASIVSEYVRLENAFRSFRESLKDFVDLPTQTIDGCSVKLYANTAKSADADAAIACKADGIGLYRTEFAFTIRTAFPTEDEQVRIARLTTDRMRPRRVVFRLLDLGADKSLVSVPMVPATNPALALRGIRFLVRNPDLLRTQLRALLRVSATAPIAIMLPMVTGVEDILETKRVLHEVEDSLRAASVAFDHQVPLGAMIEVPSAVLLAPRIAQVTDFGSLGTNDLTQYLLAADRDDAGMLRYYRPAHPAVIRAIETVVEAFRLTRKELTICGDIASEPRFTELLLGLGLRGFSVPPAQLLEVRAAIRTTSIGDAERLARDLAVREVDEIEEALTARHARVIERHLPTETNAAR